jgi:hypothetical protein
MLAAETVLMVLWGMGAELKQIWGPEMPRSDSFAFQTHLQPYERPQCLWRSKPANQYVGFTAEPIAARGGRARGGTFLFY